MYSMQSGDERTVSHFWFRVKASFLASEQLLKRDEEEESSMKSASCCKKNLIKIWSEKRWQVCSMKDRLVGKKGAGTLSVTSLGEADI